MNPLARQLGCLAVIVGMSGSASAQDEEIWSFNNASDVTFTKVNLADWTLEANQDRITDDTWITRRDTAGWFNIRTEVGYDISNPDISIRPSPENTEWAYDLVPLGPNLGLEITASKFAALTFDFWKASVNAFPQGAIDQPGVLHLIREDIYIDIMVTSWKSGIATPGGGFSYIRAPEPGALLLNFSALIALASLGHVRGRLHRRPSAPHRRD